MGIKVAESDGLDLGRAWIIQVNPIYSQLSLQWKGEAKEKCEDLTPLALKMEEGATSQEI